VSEQETSPAVRIADALDDEGGPDGNGGSVICALYKIEDALIRLIEKEE
jgi:hypothetical protein